MTPPTSTDWTRREFGESFVAVERMKRKDLLTYVRRLEAFTAEQFESLLCRNHARMAEKYPDRFGSDGLGCVRCLSNKVARIGKCLYCGSKEHVEVMCPEKAFVAHPTGKPMPEHDHEQCERLIRRLRPSDRWCHIPEDETHGGATHALPGPTGGVIPYCANCFIDIYGPHDCVRLGCPANPCPDFGKILEAE